jgi:hypothetical protein
MRAALSNIRYFGMRLLGFGMLFGLLFGSFTYPIVGSIIGLFWGACAGLVLGIGTGIGVSVYNRLFVQPESDFETYQRNLTYSVGLATLVVSALPLLVVFAPVAAITSAYVAHRYAEKQLPQAEKRKNEDRQVLRDGTIAQMVKRTLVKAPIFVMLAAVGTGLIHVWNVATNFYLPPIATEVITQSILLTIGVVIYGFILATLIGLTNGIFIHFMNHLHFTADTPKADYKRLIVPLVTAVTLLMTTIAAGFFGAPLAAIVAGWGANSYVDWYYEGQEKAKRDARYNRLLDAAADEVEDDEVITAEEAAYLWHEAD